MPPRTYERSKSAFDSARAAWADIESRTSKDLSDNSKEPMHTSRKWRWKVYDAR